MAKKTRLHVVLGSPWLDALICYLASRSPYRPWHIDSALQHGDTAIVVLDTEPASVLTTATAKFRRDGFVPKFVGSWWAGSLRTVTEVEHAAGTRIGTKPRLLDDGSADAVVGAVDDYSTEEPWDRVGRSSLAAARVLLASNGTCAGCGRTLPLNRADARDQVIIHMVDAPSAIRGVVDWPVALCRHCAERMKRKGFTTFLDYKLQLHPPCPQCSVRRTRATVFGMLTEDASANLPPWHAAMGCCVTDKQWICGQCEHQW